MGYCRLAPFYALLIILTVGIVSNGAPAEPAGEVSWRREFDALCGQVERSMNMTSEELRSYLQRCTLLKGEIEKLEPTQRKVYLKRLEMCQKLLSYMLERSLQGEGK